MHENDGSKGKRSTGALLLSTKSSAKSLDTLLQVVFLLFHVLNSLVSFTKETLQPPNFGKKATADFESEFWIGHLSA